jgi:hypothetical protein
MYGSHLLVVQTHGPFVEVIYTSHQATENGSFARAVP